MSAGYDEITRELEPVSRQGIQYRAGLLWNEVSLQTGSCSVFGAALTVLKMRKRGDYVKQ